MNKGAAIALTVAAVAGALGAGYWLGSKGTIVNGKSPVAQVAATEPAKKEPKILFYRNPMGLPDTSPTPKKDPMGMDYIPVYEGGDEDAGGEPAAANQIKISTAKVQKLGVRYEAAAMRDLARIVHAVGRVEANERLTYTVAPKFEGWIEKLHVNTTGQPVGRGQPLLEVYSPELVSAQEEYAIASQGQQALRNASPEAQASMKQLAKASLTRLRNWDISDEQLKALSRSSETRRTLTYRSPVNGIVMEKKAVQGMRFMPGDVLYQITDLSSVWILADVFEQDLALVKPGQTVKVRFDAYPGKELTAKVTYIYPTLNAQTRTVPVRLELANPGGLLKPAMYADIELAAPTEGKVLTIPTSAVIFGGTSQTVLVKLAEGRFESREVKLGARNDNYVEVLEGVKDGEQVVVAANFLIDAESNLKAAIGGLGGHTGHGSAAKTDAASPAAKPAAAGHKAEGTVDSVDAKAGTVSLNHGPVETLKWPAMTMEFKVANAALLKDLKPGTSVAFEFVERQPGEWVITGIKPMGSAKAASQTAPASANSHAGH